MITTIEPTEEDVENLAVTFPGGVSPSVEDVLNNAARLAGLYVTHIHVMRYNAAVSGAMRWPWSQEAVIEGPAEPRYL